MSRLPLILSSLLCLLSHDLGLASDWPQWRGPNRDGSVKNAKWSASLAEPSLKQAWRVELAPSYSGPIVQGNLVFTTETEDKQKEVVRALDRRTGKEVWKASWEGALSVPFFAKANGDWIRSTPACDGERLYVAGMRDVLVCLDAQSGKQVWRFDFVEKLGTALPAFGFVCSPLIDESAVYVQAGGGICKLDKLTGELLWRSLNDGGGMSGSAFSSPFIATLGGERQMIVQARERLAGVRLKDGKELWSQPVKAFRGMNILTPLVFGDGIFTSSYGGSTSLFKVAQSESGYTVSEGWSLKDDGYMSTPVVIDGIAYEHLRSQRLMAVDLKTGTKLWESDQRFGKYWSIVSNGDRMLALDQNGTLLLLGASREKFDLIDQRKVSDAETWAHVAVADDQIFIRDLNGLTAWTWKTP